MIPDPDGRFRTALRQTAATLFGPGHPVAQATTPEALQAAVAALPEGDRDRLMSATHRHMREDFAAIRSFLPGAAGTLH